MSPRPGRVSKRTRAKPLTVISFYSQGDGSSYEEEARILEASLLKAGIGYEIQAVPSKGDWYDGTAFKAEFILDCRERLRGPLLWVDADAVVHRDCSPFFEELGALGIDFAAHYFRGPAKGHDKRQVHAKGWRLLSGTTFWGDTPMALKLAKTWLALNEALQGQGIRAGGGQKNLWYAVTCLEKMGLRVTRLPGRYCWVFDKPWAYPKGEKPIIEHTIASRDHRASRMATPERAARIETLKEGVT